MIPKDPHYDPVDLLRMDRIEDLHCPYVLLLQVIYHLRNWIKLIQKNYAWADYQIVNGGVINIVKDFLKFDSIALKIVKYSTRVKINIFSQKKLIFSHEIDIFPTVLKELFLK